VKQPACKLLKKKKKKKNKSSLLPFEREESLKPRTI
jgi:hypothetical protein